MLRPRLFFPCAPAPLPTLRAARPRVRSCAFTNTYAHARAHMHCDDDAHAYAQSDQGHSSLTQQSRPPAAGRPNHRAEAKYITDGVTGNYEKALENAAAGGLASDSRADLRGVAELIVDSAYRGVRDCTGTTDAHGVHGPGKGTPPCPLSVCHLSLSGFQICVVSFGRFAGLPACRSVSLQSRICCDLVLP